MTHEHPHKIRVYHATAPTCHWSWGYEAVFNRLRLVYGKQVDVRTMTLCVWDNFDQYLKEYEMKWAEFNPWLKEIQAAIDLPVAYPLERRKVPFNVMPASVAAMAAYRQGEAKGQRFVRAILRRSCVEAQDVSGAAALEDAAVESRLDLPTFRRDVRDKAAREREYASQGHSWPELPLSYFAIVASDGHRHVVLEHAFDPLLLEGAIDYLSGGRLRKRRPTDIAEYLANHGAAPAREIERVFSLTSAQARAKLKALEEAGKARRQELAGAPHWTAA
jgi:predicted DsbA family dithiol-disulfide isomerase